jgi:hypothetical protein
MEQTLTKQEKRKIYRGKNKEKIQATTKIWYENNKDEIAEYHIEYRIKNKDNEEMKTVKT